jgi:hypothetical protein
LQLASSGMTVNLLYKLFFQEIFFPEQHQLRIMLMQIRWILWFLQLKYERYSDLLPEILPVTSAFLFCHETPWIILLVLRLGNGPDSWVRVWLTTGESSSQCPGRLWGLSNVYQM